MQLALASLPLVPQHVLVDSRTIPAITQPQNSFDKGDGLNFSIASASIVAKVYRDRLMMQLDALYPGYGFASHKGYATAEHQNAIRELGPCPVHRRSFDYIREICGEYCELYYAMKARGARVASRVEMASWGGQAAALGGDRIDVDLEFGPVNIGYLRRARPSIRASPLFSSRQRLAWPTASARRH